jgi:hypothetical protein
MPVYTDTTLLAKPDVDTKITKRLLNRRAQQIAVLVGAETVQVLEGSVPHNIGWRFTFLRPDGHRLLVLSVLGTRGQVYTALGNWHAGARDVLQAITDLPHVPST